MRMMEQYTQFKKDMYKVEHELQSNSNSINNWCYCNSMTINAQKTIVCYSDQITNYYKQIKQ